MNTPQPNFARLLELTIGRVSTKQIPILMYLSETSSINYTHHRREYIGEEKLFNIFNLIDGFVYVKF